MGIGDLITLLKEAVGSTLQWIWSLLVQLVMWLLGNQVTRDAIHQLTQPAKDWLENLPAQALELVKSDQRIQATIIVVVALLLVRISRRSPKSR